MLDATFSSCINDFPRRESSRSHRSSFPDTAIAEQFTRPFQRSLVSLMKTLKQENVKKNVEMQKWVDKQREKGLIQTLDDVVRSSWDVKTHIAALSVLRYIVELRPEVADELDTMAVFVRDAILEYEQDAIQDAPASEHLRTYAGLQLLEVMAVQTGTPRNTVSEKHFSDCLSVPLFLLNLGKRISSCKRSECGDMLFRAYRAGFQERIIGLCLEHPYRRLFGEINVQVANDLENVFQSTAVQLLTDVFKRSEGKQFLYTGDLNILADVLLRDAGQCSDCAVLCLRCLRAYRRRYAEIDYRKDEIGEMLSEYSFL